VCPQDSEISTTGWIQERWNIGRMVDVTSNLNLSTRNGIVTGKDTKVMGTAGSCSKLGVLNALLAYYKDTEDTNNIIKLLKIYNVTKRIYFTLKTLLC